MYTNPYLLSCIQITATEFILSFRDEANNSFDSALSKGLILILMVSFFLKGILGNHFIKFEYVVREWIPHVRMSHRIVPKYCSRRHTFARIMMHA